MRKTGKKSVVPIYGAAAVWVIYCLFFRLYKISDFLLIIILTGAAYAVLSKIFPGETYIEKPEESETAENRSDDIEKTGDPEKDALLKDGELAISEMRRINASIKKKDVNDKIEELIKVTDKIFKDVLEDPDDYPSVRRFADYFIPMTIKLLNAYDRMGDSGVEGENVLGTMSKIEDILDKTVDAYKKQLDSLFQNQAIDIDTDITVLENMMKREGLSGGDFDPAQKNKDK